MNCGNLTHLISLVFFFICSVYGYDKVYEDKVPRQEKMDEIIFVVEMITHAAIEPESDKLNKVGKDKANSIGRNRRAEYGKQNKLISKSPRPGEILSLST